MTFGAINCSRIDYSDTFCRGIPVCDQYSSMEQMDCETNEDVCLPELYYNCPQVPDSKYHNHECPNLFYLSSNHFDCLNRMDEATSLFKKTLFKQKVPSPNLSHELDFDNNGINCTKNDSLIKLKWTFEDFDEFHPIFPSEVYLDGCLTMDGKLIERLTMFYLLLKDQSFDGRPFIPQRWLDF